jgi:hypothetical protein
MTATVTSRSRVVTVEMVWFSPSILFALRMKPSATRQWIGKSR